jgi:hypothetical protein
MGSSRRPLLARGMPFVPDPADTHIVGVFQDAQWARRGLEALMRDGFQSDIVTVMAISSPDVSLLFAEIP